uniref:Uncharacterized protein n=1 Tax=Arundo donax TaxID=35708 RepID=A0A0A8ZQL2_ARUDO
MSPHLSRPACTSTMQNAAAAAVFV